MYRSLEIQQARVVLGVTENSTLRQIKEAYRALALKSHPDHNAAETATAYMQSINNAYSILEQSKNGTVLASDDKLNSEADYDDDYDDAEEDDDDLKQNFFNFYKFFFEARQATAKDFISEEKFQEILSDIKDRMKKNEGWVYAGHGALFGLNAPQIKRLLAHSAEYGGNNFHFSGQSLRPEVLVCLLRYLADYTVENTNRCKLDLSKNSLSHPEVVEALAYLLDNAKTQWALNLNECSLNLTPELAEHFSANKTVYSLSLCKNRLRDSHVNALKSIIEKNTFIEELDFSDNQFNNSSLLYLANSITRNQSLRDLSLSMAYDAAANFVFPDLSDDLDASSVEDSEIFKNLDSDDEADKTCIPEIHKVPALILTACLSNQFKLEKLSIKYNGIQDAKLLLSLPILITVSNPRIHTLVLEGFRFQPQAIAHLLAHNFTGLKSLSFHECTLTDGLLQAISEVINDLPALENLFFSSPLGLHAGQAAIFRKVSQNKTLKGLFLSHFSITGSPDELAYKMPQAEVAEALDLLFRNNKSLKELDIQACNVFTDKAAQKLAATMQEHNRSLTDVTMFYVMPSRSLANIENQASRNKALINPQPSISKKVTTKAVALKSEISLSKEAFGFLLAEIKRLILIKSDTFEFKSVNNKKQINFGNHLAKWSDDHISQEQLDELMTTALKGNFARINLSNESYLPVEHNAIIIKKITAHYYGGTQSPATGPLLELNLSENNLTGCIPDLITLISNPDSKLETLHLSGVKMMPQEMHLLVKAIQEHQTLRDVSIYAWELRDEKRRSEYKFNPVAIEEMLRINKNLRCINLNCYGLEAKEASNVISAFAPKYTESAIYSVVKKLTFFAQSNFFNQALQSPEVAYNTNIESLSLGLGNQPVDPQLAWVLKNNTAIKRLTLRFEHSYIPFHNSLLAALNSPCLNELSVISYRLIDVFDAHAEMNAKKDSQLSCITMNQCDIDIQTLGILKALPLKKLNLSGNRLFADIHGKALLELICTKGPTLEELDLSANCLGTNRDSSKFGDNSRFLTDLSKALQFCVHLKMLSMHSPNDFNEHDTLIFVRRLKKNNLQLQHYSYYFREKFNTFKNRNMDDEVSCYTQFIVAEMLLKNQFIANRNHIVYSNTKSIAADDKTASPIEGQDFTFSWTRLEKLYKTEIDRLVKKVHTTLENKINGNVFGRILGENNQSSLKWTKEHETIFNYAIQGDYAAFHNEWSQWKTVNGDTEETIDINLSILLDWVDECLLFYANSIKAFNIPNYIWPAAFPTEEILFPAYEKKLGILEDERINASLAFKQEMAAEIAARDAKREEEKEILKQARGADQEDDDVHVTVIKVDNEPKCAIM